MHDSFKAKANLDVAGKSYQIFRVDAVANSARLPFSMKILLENLLRFEDGVTVKRADIEATGQLGPAGGAGYRDPVPPGARADAGLHRRARRRRPGRDARRHDRARRRPGQDQPAAARGAGHRPLGAGGQLRHRPGLRSERGAGVLAQQGALRLSEVGPEGVRQLQGGAAGHRHRASGQRRVSGPRGVRPRGRRRAAGLSGHPGRHRFPHHHDQRRRCAGLGRRRYRGRGVDARPTGVDADPEGSRREADRKAARGRHRHRSGADHRRDAAQARRGGQVRRVLRPGRQDPADGRPLHHRQHGPGIRRHLRPVPDRRRDAGLPAPDRPLRRAGRAGGGLRQGAGHVRRRRQLRGRLQRKARIRHRHRGAEPGRPQTPAGSRPAD